LQQAAARLLGAEQTMAAEEREAAAIAEVERELRELYPWYADPRRLQQVWAEYGSAGPKRNPHSHLALPPGARW
jgi:hypothetical protein